MFGHLNQSEDTWISLGYRLVKLCSTKRDLRLKQLLQDVLELTDIWSPHAILDNYCHIFRRLKSNLKCFFIDECHCIEHWRSKWIIARKQRSFVVVSFFASTFLGINGPSMMRSFPLLQESSELWFRFCLHNFGTKCLSKVNLRRAAG